MRRLAWVSPISRRRVLRTAAFSQELLLRLPTGWEVEVFVDDSDLVELEKDEDLAKKFLSAESPLSVYHYHRIDERSRVKPFDAFIYQIEDHPNCSFVQTCMAIWPGMVYFHDINLNRLYQSRFLHATAADDLNDLMDEQFGDDAARLGDYHVRNWSIEVFDKIYACGEEEQRGAGVVLVGSESAAAFLKSRGIDTAAILNPVLCSYSCKADTGREGASWLKEIGFSNEDLLVGYSGLGPLADRMPSVIQAFLEVKEKTREQLRRVGRRLRFLWILGDENEFRTAHAFLAGLDLPQTVLKDLRVVCAETDTQHDALFSLLHLFVSMRADSLRGLPGGVSKALACAVPVIARGLAGELPKSVVRHIDPGPKEREMLVDSLEELLVNLKRRESYSEAAREYLVNVLDAEAICAEFWVLLEEHQESLGSLLRKSESYYRKGAEELLEDLTQSFSEDAVIDSEGDGDTLAECFWRIVGKSAVIDFDWLSERRE